MAFYDYFHDADTSSITTIGRRLVDLQNDFFVRLIRRFCADPDPAILEIGCGHGFFADRCRESGLSYTAIEANAKLAGGLAKKGFDVVQDFAPPISLARKFDVIFMDQVFEHMKHRDQAIEMIETCRAHLHTRGILIICSPDIFTMREDFYSDYTHSYPTSMPVLTQILSDGSFDVIYQNYLIFFLRGQLLTRVMARMVRIAYSTGLFHLVFRKKARSAKTALLPSCVVIGRSGS